MNWNYNLRDVALEHVASQTYDENLHKFPRLDEAYRAFEWLLVRKCEECSVLISINSSQERYVYFQSGDEVSKTPDIIATYTYDNQKITIYDFMIKESDYIPF